MRITEVVVAMAAITSACGSHGQPEPVREGDVPPTSLSTLRADIVALVGDPTCSDEAQCRAMPFGSKPCGGPWSYLVYSTGATDSARLAAAVARYNVEEARLNTEEGRVSDCAVVTPPVPQCLEGRCTATR